MSEDEREAFKAKLRSIYLVPTKTASKRTVDDHGSHRVVVTTADEQQDVHVFAPHTKVRVAQPEVGG